jgi:hypothetical protein
MVKYSSNNPWWICFFLPAIWAGVQQHELQFAQSAGYLQDSQESSKHSQVRHCCPDICEKCGESIVYLRVFLWQKRSFITFGRRGVELSAIF